DAPRRLEPPRPTQRAHVVLRYRATARHQNCLLPAPDPRDLRHGLLLVTRAGSACCVVFRAACTLRDVVTAPLGAPVLVVESVLSAVGTQQLVLVQQS